MEGLEGHLWTQSFLRFISQSNDEKKLRALQQIILHSQGDEKQKTDDSFTKTENLKKPAQKVIRIRAIFPKNSLRNTDMSSFKIDSSLDLSDTSCDSPKFKQNLPKDLPKNLNVSKIQKPKKFPENDSPKICSFKSSVTPIMGKWALLTKYNNILRSSNPDAEIVTKIVMEKFKNILNNYHRRSFMRKKTNEDINEDANFDSTITNSQLETKDNTSDAKTDSSAAIREPHLDIIYQNMDPLWEEEEELFLARENKALEQTKNEALNQIITNDDQLLEPHLAKEVSSGKIPNQSENINFCEKLKEEALFEKKIKYDAQKFLEDALGEELNKYSSLGSINGVSESTLPFSSNENICSSINTTQISSLYKASTYLHNIFSRKKRQGNDTDSSTPISYEELFTDNQSPSNSKASTLIREAAAQNQIILQTCKALNFCESSKQFKSSMEYVEAEKILLLATLKYKAVKKELHKVDYEGLKDLGHITISNLAFPVAAEIPQSDEVSQWSFAVVCCGCTVLATETVRAQNGDIRFDKSFNFENLDVDFEITISIYTLDVKNDVKNSDLKFHIKQETTTCPSPNKLFNFHKPSKLSKAAYSYERRNPSFILWGTTTIRIADLTKPDAFKLTQIPNSSTLKGIMNADLSSSIELTETYSGFLTIGSEAGGYATWNRRWCHLNGFQLQYWNYPAEEELAEPIGTIDLRFCVASRISQVDRELCARPRTLLLETGRLSSPRDQNSLMMLCKSSYTITKHYLSADNHKEMIKWQNQLNSVVSSLRNWNCMKCQLYFSR